MLGTIARPKAKSFGILTLLSVRNNYQSQHRISLKLPRNQAKPALSSISAHCLSHRCHRIRFRISRFTSSRAPRHVVNLSGHMGESRVLLEKSAFDRIVSIKALLVSKQECHKYMKLLKRWAMFCCFSPWRQPWVLASWSEQYSSYLGCDWGAAINIFCSQVLSHPKLKAVVGAENLDKRLILLKQDLTDLGESVMENLYQQDTIYCKTAW